MGQGQALLRDWPGLAPRLRQVIPCPRHPQNAVEALQHSLRKIIKTRGNFPSADAALKQLYLAITVAAKCSFPAGPNDTRT
jgi:transposase-like protein